MLERLCIESVICFICADFQAQERWQEQAQPWSCEAHQVFQLREMLSQGCVQPPTNQCPVARSVLIV